MSNRGRWPPRSCCRRLRTGDAELWVGRIGTHPSVRKAQLGLRIAKLETDKARAGHLPVVDLVGSLGTVNQRGSAVVATGNLPGRNEQRERRRAAPTCRCMRAMRCRTAWRETVLLEEKSRNDLEGAQRGAALRDAPGLQRRGVGPGAGEGVRSGREPASLLALEATQVGYRVGVRVNIDVLNAQTQLFQTRRDLAKARYDVLVGSLRLRQAAGQLKPDDLSLIEQLIAQ